MTISDYRPIADYAVIGDTRSIALVSREGSIDWLCWPRFDSPSCFARLLDARRGGSFVVQPAVLFTATRRYVGETNVLETTFVTEQGRARLLDLMPVIREEEKKTRLTPFRQLLRRIEVVDGEMPIRVLFAPRLDYARTVPRLSSVGAGFSPPKVGALKGAPTEGTIVAHDGPTVMHLRTDIPLAIEGGDARAEITLRAGDVRWLALAYDDHSPAVYPTFGDEAVECTLSFWREWSSQLDYDGPYREHVLRSALVLKLLAYAPSGAIVAAPTTSLPEKIGGVRNWDYRYCWLRDASFTVAALYDCGFEVEGSAFVGWLLYSTRLTHPNLQMLYDVFGESHLPEHELEHLEGYRGSRPVRIGNDAHGQFQLDVFGELLGAIEEYTQRGETLPRDVRRLAQRLADRVCERWREADSGIWEKRSGREQHVHGKVMSWMALDTALRLAAAGHTSGDLARWRRERDEIKRVVLEHGFNRQMNSFVSILDGDELDASLLYIARVGFLEPDDPRMLSTITAIRQRLGRDDLIYRYEVTTDDGLPPGEGAFLACSFWLAEALTLAGRVEEARALYEKLLARSNDVGLFSEEIEVETGELLGNFPQALTHIALMNAALCIQRLSS